jgi:antitoxin (DNA-binding transcriptional repressor) of toxin-antitoxin stability system
MTQIEFQQAKEHFNELMELAAKGEDVIIAKNDKPFVKITAMVKPKKKRTFGSAKGMFKVSSDFDAPLEDFAEYM